MLTGKKFIAVSKIIDDIDILKYIIQKGECSLDDIINNAIEQGNLMFLFDKTGEEYAIYCPYPLEKYEDYFKYGLASARYIDSLEKIQKLQHK